MGFDFAEKPAKFIESVESYLDILISFRTMNVSQYTVLMKKIW